MYQLNPRPEGQYLGTNHRSLKAAVNYFWFPIASKGQNGAEDVEHTAALDMPVLFWGSNRERRSIVIVIADPHHRSIPLPYSDPVRPGFAVPTARHHWKHSTKWLLHIWNSDFWTLFYSLIP